MFDKIEAMCKIFTPTQITLLMVNYSLVNQFLQFLGKPAQVLCMFSCFEYFELKIKAV